MPDGSDLAGAKGAHELAELFPAPKSVTIAGRLIEIKQCGIGQSGRILSAGWPLFMKTGGDITVAVFEDPENRDQAVEVLCIAIDGDSEWIATLHPVYQAELASHWLDVNAAFFLLRLLPMHARVARVVQSIEGADGRTSSPT